VICTYVKIDQMESCAADLNIWSVITFTWTIVHAWFEEDLGASSVEMPGHQRHRRRLAASARQKARRSYADTIMWTWTDRIIPSECMIYLGNGSMRRWSLAHLLLANRSLLLTAGGLIDTISRS
jgi:hypothetical protein